MEKEFEQLKEEKDQKPNIAELAGDYVETYYKLTVLNINKKIADISAVASFTVLAALICCFVAMFLGIAAALWIGTLLGSTALGFLVFGAFCLLLLLIVFLTRKKVFFPLVKNLIIKGIYE